ncbi:hypothetical protein ACTXG5_21930 [Mycobacterium sp. Dal123C01]|uniref:hypothetical protein n=1 Tax=Mycobacterium sp. Dal123C01 TaxID=3457577 RepID=UPI00403E7284
MTEHDDTVTAFKDGRSWRWRWRSPWASTHDSTAAYPTKAKALESGRTWVRETSRG